jgi:peptidoglycan/LPS O-acetylase OafA/YrhL
MAMATFSVWEHASGNLPRFLRYLGDHPVVSWTIAAVVVFSSATFRAPITPGEYGAEYFVRWFMFGVFSFFLLAPAMFGDQTRGRARRVLASRPLVYLGTISLGFYLFHLALLFNVQEWLAPAGESGEFYGSLPTVFALTFVTSIAMASISYYLVERPFLRLKDKPLAALFRRDHARATG